VIDVDLVRTRFPALSSGTVFLDNPGGTQIARSALWRMERYLKSTNANHGGAFRASRESDAVVAEARSAAADFLNAPRPEEVVFGPNMTTLTLHLSRSLGRTLAPGDEIVVTRLDHDANVAPWLLIAEDRGAIVRFVDVDVKDCTWSLDALRSALSSRTKLVAVGWASNAAGTVNDVAGACRIAREAGALSFVDAVHWAPHGPIDVQEVGCDFLACSAYKFFGPHLGLLWGRYDLLESLTAYKVRPAGKLPPDKFETGTQSFEAAAGMLGAVEYLAWIGETFGAPFRERLASRFSGRRLALKAGMEAIREQEAALTAGLADRLGTIRGLEVRGITDRARFASRVPTFSFTLDGHSPRQVCEELDRDDIAAWDGNYYALSLSERLGLEDSGGMVRVGAVHYNTLGDLDRLARSLGRIAK
jgi:cysteine desulfurase family protein (TIGR01976 family)